MYHCRCALSMQLNDVGCRGRLLIACSPPGLQLTLYLKHHQGWGALHPPAAEVELEQKLAAGQYFF